MNCNKLILIINILYIFHKQKDKELNIKHF